MVTKAITDRVSQKATGARAAFKAQLQKGAKTRAEQTRPFTLAFTGGHDEHVGSGHPMDTGPRSPANINQFPAGCDADVKSFKGDVHRTDTRVLDKDGKDLVEKPGKDGEILDEKTAPQQSADAILKALETSKVNPLLRYFVEGYASQKGFGRIFQDEAIVAHMAPLQVLPANKGANQYTYQLLDSTEVAREYSGAQQVLVFQEQTTAMSLMDVSSLGAEPTKAQSGYAFRVTNTLHFCLEEDGSITTHFKGAAITSTDPAAKEMLYQAFAMRAYSKITDTGDLELGSQLDGIDFRMIAMSLELQAVLKAMKPFELAKLMFDGTHEAAQFSSEQTQVLLSLGVDINQLMSARLASLNKGEIVEFLSELSDDAFTMFYAGAPQAKQAVNNAKTIDVSTLTSGAFKRTVEATQAHERELGELKPPQSPDPMEAVRAAPVEPEISSVDHFRVFTGPSLGGGFYYKAPRSGTERSILADDANMGRATPVKAGRSGSWSLSSLFGSSKARRSSDGNSTSRTSTSCAQEHKPADFDSSSLPVASC